MKPLAVLLLLNPGCSISRIPTSLTRQQLPPTRNYSERKKNKLIPTVLWPPWSKHDLSNLHFSKNILSEFDVDIYLKTTDLEDGRLKWRKKSRLSKYLKYFKPKYQLIATWSDCLVSSGKAPLILKMNGNIGKAKRARCLYTSTCFAKEYNFRKMCTQLMRTTMTTFLICHFLCHHQQENQLDTVIPRNSFDK